MNFGYQRRRPQFYREVIEDAFKLSDLLPLFREVYEHLEEFYLGVSAIAE